MGHKAYFSNFSVNLLTSEQCGCEKYIDNMFLNTSHLCKKKAHQMCLLLFPFQVTHESRIKKSRSCLWTWFEGGKYHIIYIFWEQKIRKSSLLVIHSFNFVSKLVSNCPAPPHVPGMASALKSMITRQQLALLAEVVWATRYFILSSNWTLALVMYAPQAQVCCNHTRDRTALLWNRNMERWEKNKGQVRKEWELTYVERNIWGIAKAIFPLSNLITFSPFCVELWVGAL